MNYLGNAFSLNMVPRGVKVDIVELDNQPSFEGLTSVVGHPTTATLLGVPFNRASVTLNKGDMLVVAQYSGPRLEEGATVLPEGAEFRWFRVVVL
jgi:hypothetical protein